MKLLVVAVSARQPEWIDTAFDEYARRMPAHLRIELVTIKPDRRNAGRSVAQMLEAEALRVEQVLPRRGARVVLDEHGTVSSTVALSNRLHSWINEGSDVAFVIGGPDGTAPRLRSSASFLLSLSTLTLPHGLARVVLAEQLYRAHSILQNHPYHRQ